MFPDVRTLPDSSAGLAEERTKMRASSRYCWTPAQFYMLEPLSRKGWYAMHPSLIYIGMLMLPVMVLIDGNRDAKQHHWCYCESS